MRNFGLIRWLSERHTISLLSFGESDQIDESGELVQHVAAPLLAVCQRVETVPLPPVRSLMRRGRDTFAQRLPDMALRLASSAYAEKLAAWLAREPFDIVHIEGIEMAPYLDLLVQKQEIEKQARFGERPAPGSRTPLIIFDDHNCEYMLQRSYALVDARNPRRWAGASYSFIQWQKLRRYEADVCRRAHRVLAVSQTDAEALRQIVPELSIAVIPNGIDTDRYQSRPPDETHGPQASPTPTLVFTGKMDFRPNVDAVSWFAKAIWPHIRAEVPDARFLAVGQRPHPSLDRLCADPSITLTGWVEEIQPYIDNATVYVAPLRMGSGTRLKLLQAMASGKAIVSTRTGAEGLAGAVPGYPAALPKELCPISGTATGDQELILVNDDDPIGFANAVVRLLRDPERRAVLGAAARSFVKTHYDWRVIVPRLEAVYAKA